MINPISPLARLNEVIGRAWQHNAFYRRFWTRHELSPGSIADLDELRRYPFVTRADLQSDQEKFPPFGTNLSDEITQFIRFHHSSGSSGNPIFWLDTAETWSWVVRGSKKLFELSGVQPEDRLFFDLPFQGGSGPWILYEGACSVGCAAATAGDAPREQKRTWLEKCNPTFLVGRAGELLKLGLALRQLGWGPGSRQIRGLILTGPSAREERRAVEDLWEAPGLNRYGMTEAGSIAAECPAHTAQMHLLANEFVAEIVDPKDGRGIAAGELGELVLTTLGRISRPIIRYRTGDLTRLISDEPCPCGRTGPRLAGGVRRKAASAIG